MYFLIISLFLNSVVWCCPVENGWKQMRPLRTDKVTVDKILGSYKITEEGYYGYSTDEAFVLMNFSTAPCKSNQYGRGKFSVSADTVLFYDVVFRKVLKIDDLEFKREKYHRDASSDLLNFVDYINSDDGVTINVTVQQGNEFVRSIRFTPSKMDSEKFACK